MKTSMFGTLTRILPMLFCALWSSIASGVGKPELAPIVEYAQSEVDPVKDLVGDKKGCYTVLTCVSNRRNFAGAIYYVNRIADGPDRVLIRFKSSGIDGDFVDGQPANLVLRVFDPNDRCVLARQIGQPEKGWFETSIDLTGQPAGRYRFATTGFHSGFVLAADPPRPIGVAGAGSIGLTGPNDYYLFIPRDVTEWRIRLKGELPGQQVVVYNEKGETVAEKLATSKNSLWWVWDGEEVALTGAKPESVWRIRHAGNGHLKMQIFDLPGVLWPDPESAAANAGDCDYVANWRIDHAWQRPLAEWLAARRNEDFVVDVKGFPAIDVRSLPDDLAIRLRPPTHIHSTFGAGVALLDNQIVDAGSPYLGIFVNDPSNVGAADEPGKDSSTGGAAQPTGSEAGRRKLAAKSINLNPDALDGRAHFYQVGYVLTLSSLYTCDARGLNPYYRHPGLKNRVMAAMFQLMLRVPERQTVDMDFVKRKMLGNLAAQMHHELPPDLAEAFRAGLIEHMGRDCYFDGHVSNQGMNVILGLKHVADITGDSELKRFYEQRIGAFVDGKFRAENHGQTPTGYYREVGGFDGAYNTYSAQCLIALWHMTHDPRIYKSLERNFEFVRHLALSMPDGSFVSARNWNTRTDSNAFRWHDHRNGASLPGCATFVLPDKHDGATWNEAEKAREHLQKWWGVRYPEKVLDGRKWWASFGGDDYRKYPPFAAPLPLACREPGNFVRRFGREYTIVKSAPWYGIFFGGDEWGTGKSGSALAALWHEDFGPLILGDTKIKSVHQEKFEKLKPDEKAAHELMLTLVDAWDYPGKRVDTENALSEISGDLASGEFVATIKPRKGSWSLRREFNFSAMRFSSPVGAADNAGLVNHDLYLPLVIGPQIALAVLDENGAPLKLKPGDRRTVSKFRWTRAIADAGEKSAGTNKSIELSFGPPVEVFVRCDEMCAPAKIRVFRVRLNEAAKTFVIEVREDEPRKGNKP